MGQGVSKPSTGVDQAQYIVTTLRARDVATQEREAEEAARQRSDCPASTRSRPRCGISTRGSSRPGIRPRAAAALAQGPLDLIGAREDGRARADRRWRRALTRRDRTDLGWILRSPTAVRWISTSVVLTRSTIDRNDRILIGVSGRAHTWLKQRRSRFKPISVSDPGCALDEEPSLDRADLVVESLEEAQSEQAVDPEPGGKVVNVDREVVEAEAQRLEALHAQDVAWLLADRRARRGDRFALGRAVAERSMISGVTCVCEAAVSSASVTRRLLCFPYTRDVTMIRSSSGSKDTTFAVTVTTPQRTKLRAWGRMRPVKKWPTVS